MGLFIHGKLPNGHRYARISFDLVTGAIFARRTIFQRQHYEHMRFSEPLRKHKKPLIALGIWMLFWVLVISLGSGKIQTVGIVLLLATISGAGGYAVFRIMRAIH